MTLDTFRILLELAGLTSSEVDDLGDNAKRAADKFQATDDDVLAMSEAQRESLADTAVMGTAQDVSNEASEEAGVDAFVLLGPDDGITRPFCEAALDHWFTAEEIARLDNGTGLPVETFVGGYGCRHALYPLFGDQTNDYPHGNVDVVNRAAA